jgi:hypothetical protein
MKRPLLLPVVLVVVLISLDLVAGRPTGRVFIVSANGRSYIVRTFSSAGTEC